MARAIKTRPARKDRLTSEDRSTPLDGNPAWAIQRSRGLHVVESRALAKLGWLAHGFSTRPGGASLLEVKPVLNLGFTEWDERERVLANREKFMDAVGARELPLVTPRQFHSDVIYVAFTAGAEAPKADAL